MELAGGNFPVAGAQSTIGMNAENLNTGAAIAIALEARCAIRVIDVGL